VIPAIPRELATHHGWVASVYLDVATEVDLVVESLKAELLALTGDVRARSLVRDALGERSRSITTEIPGPTPDDHTIDHSIDEEVRRVAAERAAGRTRDVLTQFEQERGRRSGLAAEGLRPVIHALQLNQAGAVLLRDDPSSELEIWIGPEPPQLALTEEGLCEVGAPVLGTDRADTALVRAVAGSGASWCYYRIPHRTPSQTGRAARSAVRHRPAAATTS
jgi:Bacterial archaeo-eukaryotic release factor family 2